MVKQNVKNIVELILRFIGNAFRALPHIAKIFLRCQNQSSFHVSKTPDEEPQLIPSAWKKSVRSRTYGKPRNVYALSGYQ
jgi:hypothetical protein